MPGGVYQPQAEAGGTDDYRCILLDPHLSATSFVSGVVLVPGNPKLVHHAILYRVDPSQVELIATSRKISDEVVLSVRRRAVAGGEREDI